jgi:hypothetical protein
LSTPFIIIGLLEQALSAATVAIIRKVFIGGLLEGCLNVAGAGVDAQHAVTGLLTPTAANWMRAGTRGRKKAGSRAGSVFGRAAYFEALTM